MPRRKNTSPFEPGTYVRAIDSFSGDLEDANGEMVPWVGKAEKIYAADDPAVQKWPQHFEPLEPQRQRPPVEQATAAPGERRPVNV